MTEREDFLAWIKTTLHEAEVALHNGEAAPAGRFGLDTSPSACSVRCGTQTVSTNSMSFSRRLRRASPTAPHLHLTFRRMT
jgi:hypothetical protein